MIFNVYAGIRNGQKAHEKKVRYVDSKSRTRYHPENETKKRSLLEIRVSSLLKKYENDQATREKILSHLNMYQINIMIAKECNDKKAISNRTKEFNRFLDQF